MPRHTLALAASAAAAVAVLLYARRRRAGAPPADDDDPASRDSAGPSSPFRRGSTASSVRLSVCRADDTFKPDDAFSGRLSEGRERTHSMLGGDRTRDGPPDGLPADGSDTKTSDRDSFAMAQIMTS